MGLAPTQEMDGGEGPSPRTWQQYLQRLQPVGRRGLAAPMSSTSQSPASFADETVALCHSYTTRSQRAAPALPAAGRAASCLPSADDQARPGALLRALTASPRSRGDKLRLLAGEDISRCEYMGLPTCPSRRAAPALGPARARTLDNA